MQDRRQLKSFMTDIFKHCARDYHLRHKQKRPLNERRKAMDSELCHICQIKIYGRAGNFKCPVHDDFKKNYATGELEKPEEENNSFVIYHGA